MMDVLDFYGNTFLGTKPGDIARESKPMLESFGLTVQAGVIAKASFLCLSTVGPAAMSLLPALSKGAYATKLIFPQEVLPGWIVRFIPCLYAPLTGIFILLLGQMFSDWFVMGGVLCLVTSQLATATFTSGFESATEDKMLVEQLQVRP